MSFIKRRRRRKFYVMLGIGLITGSVVGSLGMKGYLSYQQRCDKIKMQKDSVPIYVLKEEKQKGEVIRNEDIVIKYVPKEFGMCSVSKKDIINKEARDFLREGIILYENLVYEKASVDAGVRKHSYSYIRQIETLRKNDKVDIRISFPNGADFVVLSNKTVLNDVGGEKENSQDELRLWVHVDEEEILRMSSAVVDSYINEGAYLYAVSYLNELQDAAVVNYPVNEVVEELIKKDPNIIKIAQEKKTLEMRKFLDGVSVICAEETHEEGQDSLAYYQ